MGQYLLVKGGKVSKMVKSLRWMIFSPEGFIGIAFLKDWDFVANKSGN